MLTDSPISSSPPDRGSKPTMALNSVDLPTPFGPITPTMPPWGSVNDKSSISTRSPNAFLMCLASMTFAPRRGGTGMVMSDTLAFSNERASAAICS